MATEPQFWNNDFILKLVSIIEKNLANEQFGVSELAAEINMSRSNLLRKVKKISGLSVSQFIRQVRLKKAMEMLKKESSTVSEIGYKVGFSSNSYFIKCFHEFYGFPPGEVSKRDFSHQVKSTETNQSQTHQLAAIMFTDIQGDTAMMQSDEQKGLEVRDRHRKIFNAYMQKFNGKILQYFGGGTLSTFSSAVDAVRCAIEMQLAFKEEPGIPVRIGIHSGDIIFEEDDIIGDGVNVASRIESLAVSGSVFVSEKVFDEVKNKAGIHCRSMGMFELKNVHKPLEVYAITNAGLTIPEKEEIDGKLKGKASTDIKWQRKKKRNVRLAWLVVLLVFVVGAVWVTNSGYFKLAYKATFYKDGFSDKSIAVLPFINDSNDSSNVYIINGLMESVLNKLQKINDLRVISRTSVEKYRNTDKIIPDLSKELNVHYFVEGSGQKIGDRILLTIQLVDGYSDSHLWSEQYDRQVKDIFYLQQEIAKKIAGQIQVLITPEENAQIEKVPTENVVAYDYFLKALDLMNQNNFESLKQGISYLDSAITVDENFARAYAARAMAYYYLDIFNAPKKYVAFISENADRAMLADPELPQSLIAKALSFMVQGKMAVAIPYLEKALDLNPNSAMVLNYLSDYYANHVPNSAKYLQYAIKGIRLNPAASDSATSSYIYLHLANALVQTGFVKEADWYINKSLEYNPANIYSHYVKAYIVYAKDRNAVRLKNSLIKTLAMDTTRLDVMQEVAKVCYYLRDYKTSYRYYERFTDLREQYNFELFRSEDLKIAFVFHKMGFVEEAAKFVERYRWYAENNQSIYRHMNLSMLYAYEGDVEKSMAHLKQFAEEEEDYFYWVVVFLEDDPFSDSLKKHPGFTTILRTLKRKFWERHKEIKTSLKQQNLI